MAEDETLFKGHRRELDGNRSVGVYVSEDGSTYAIQGTKDHGEGPVTLGLQFSAEAMEAIVQLYERLNPKRQVGRRILESMWKFTLDGNGSTWEHVAGDRPPENNDDVRMAT